MEITVHNKYVRISPRKARPVLYGLRGQNAQQAEVKLGFTNKKAAYFVRNLIKSGIAAAKENYLEVEQITIKSVYCNEAPRLKRAIAWSKGQSRRITKRGSHFTLVLEAPEAKKPTSKKQIKKVESEVKTADDKDIKE